MNQYFVYHPYKSYRYVLPVAIGFSVMAFIFMGTELSQSTDFTIFNFVIGSGFLIAAIYCSRRANTVIVFDTEGLRVTMGTRKYYRFVPWDDIQYAYSARNIKGFQFLILSPMPLNENKIKKYVCEGTDGRDICVNSVVSILLWGKDDAAKVEELISQHGLIVSK